MRKIIHVDMDCFYAAVEIRDRPELKYRPVAVGGRPGGRGVLTTANYVARRYGVKSAMPSTRAAKLCPDLVFIKPDFAKYKKESRIIREIFGQYTDLVEPLSLDEAYLDVTESPRCEGSATLMAHEIRREIFKQCELTASAGVAPNKFLAKVASDWNKPNGQLTIGPNDIEPFVKKLPVRKIPGVGKVTARKMELMGIHTCLDLQRLSQHELGYKFGKWGLRLFQLCRGEDSRKVCTDWERKSLSVERTFGKDLESFEACELQVAELYQEFIKRWEKNGIPDEKIKGSMVKLRYSDFTTTTHETVTQGVPSEEDFQRLLVGKLGVGDFRPVRLLGIGVKLQSATKKPENINQLSLF